MTHALIAILGLLMLVSACAPIPVARAEQDCLEDARLAVRPRGTGYLGVGSGGHHYGRVQISISSDYLLGRDPSQVFDSCVMQKSGQPPSRPLYEQPDWRG